MAENLKEEPMENTEEIPAKEPECQTCEKDKKDKKHEKQELTALKEQNKKLKEDADAANDKYLRMIAEYDNYRKRATKERESLYQDAYADVVKEILPMVDNLERAAQYKESEKIAEGVTLILAQFESIMSKLGVTEIEAEGVAFDPNVHNAVMHIEDEAYGENVVIDVLQKGYQKGEKVIRHAMVKVAN